MEVRSQQFSALGLNVTDYRVLVLTTETPRDSGSRSALTVPLMTHGLTSVPSQSLRLPF